MSRTGVGASMDHQHKEEADHKELDINHDLAHAESQRTVDWQEQRKLLKKQQVVEDDNPE